MQSKMKIHVIFRMIKAYLIGKNVLMRNLQCSENDNGYTILND